MRRAAVVLGAALVAVLAAGSPAAAATATMASPSAGQTISGAVALQVAVSRGLAEGQPTVAVRLADGSGATYPGSQAAALACQSGCGAGQTSMVYGGQSFDPRRPAAFGLSSPLANGTYRLVPVIDGQPQTPAAVTLSVFPSPVTDLAAAVDDRTVRLTWTRAPEPDVSAYRVQRRPDGGNWKQVASVSGSAASYSETVAYGSYDYRVVTVRPDGHGGELTATSSATSAEVAEPEPDPTPTGGTSGGSTDGGSTSGGSTDGGSTTGGSTSGGSTSGGSTSGGSTTGGDGGSTSGGSDGGSSDGGATDGSGAGPTEGPTPGATPTRTSSASRRVAPPPGVRRSVMLDGGAIALPEPQVAGPRGDGGGEEEAFYFGQDQPFSEELDYSAVDPVTGEPRFRNSVVRRLVPGAVQEFVVTRLNSRLVLVPVAAGLVMTALGLHTFRWMRAS